MGGPYQSASWLVCKLLATVNWGCFHHITIRNRSVTVDFWMVLVERERKKKREKKNLESRYSSPALSVARVIHCLERFLRRRMISSPRVGRINVFPRGEKERGDGHLHAQVIAQQRIEEVVSENNGSLLITVQVAEEHKNLSPDVRLDSPKAQTIAKEIASAGNYKSRAS
ncbi:hypothetical protein GW17_00034156 [Ensete ventricosum]|nr:hypothetical protein GW17_00034156 [Ensete ventricosum]